MDLVVNFIYELLDYTLYYNSLYHNFGDKTAEKNQINILEKNVGEKPYNN